jgi:hypothetical protein
MPTNKLRPQKLQCPFCPTISTRGTGLVAHVRAKHPREYGRWNKNPNRLLQADAAASRQPEAAKNLRLHPVRSSASVEVAEAASPNKKQPKLSATPVLTTGENDVHEALSLLQKAYEQLSTRKQSIESELARIEGLRGEHEALTAQVAALDQAMKAFQDQPVRHPKTA